MRTFFALTTIILLASCGGVLDQRPSTVEDYLQTQISEQSKDKIELVSFEKLDGIERDLGGAETYVLEFKAVVRIKEQLYKNCGGCKCWEAFGVDNRQKIYSDGEICDRKKVGANQKFQLLGDVSMLKSDNGWRVEHLRITDYEDLGGAELDPNYQHFVGEYRGEGGTGLSIQQNGIDLKVVVIDAGEFVYEADPVEGKLRLRVGKRNSGFIQKHPTKKDCVTFGEYNWEYCKIE